MSRRRYGEKGQPYQLRITSTYKAIFPSERPQCKAKKTVLQLLYVHFLSLKNYEKVNGLLEMLSCNRVGNVTK